MSGRCRRRVLRRRVRDGGRRGRPPDPDQHSRCGQGHGRRDGGVTLGAHGTYVANAAASVADGAWRIALGCVGGGAGARDGGRGAARGQRRRRGVRARRRSRASARRSTHRPTSTRPRTTAAASPRRRWSAQSYRQPRERRGERGRDADDEPVRDRHRERRAGREGGARAAAPRALPARRPRPHGHARRLRHGELRGVQRPPRRRRS